MTNKEALDFVKQKEKEGYKSDLYEDGYRDGFSDGLGSAEEAIKGLNGKAYEDWKKGGKK